MRMFENDLRRVRPKARHATAAGDPAPHLARNRIWEGWPNAPRGLNRFDARAQAWTSAEASLFLDWQLSGQYRLP